MFVYNITTKVDHAVVDEWLHWQKEIHIPEIMATGFFGEYRFYKLLEHDDESGAVFVTQFTAGSLSDYHTYLLKSAPALREKSLAKWGEKAVSFRTLLQNVQ